MKTVFLFSLLSITALADGFTYEVQCKNGLPPSYKQVIYDQVSISFVCHDSIMAPSCDEGQMLLRTLEDVPVFTKLEAGPEWHWSDLSFSGELSGDRYSVETKSDLLKKVGIQIISTLNIYNSHGWEKSFQLICERTH
jgi:hypothetical protein